MKTSGVLNVLKPPGMTSHDVVSFIRRIYGIKKVGHAGTLDPAAAGVLPVAVGQATRLIEYMTEMDKGYRAEITFGYETDTGDDIGQTIRVKDCVLPDIEEIIATISTFIGTIEQIPPMYSAIKINGKKMYELARNGVVIDLPARTIQINYIKVVHYSHETKSIIIDVNCSKGTYIRSLCRDIGVKLNLPVTMSFLVRTRVGSFELSQAHTLEEIANNPLDVLLPADYSIKYMAKICLTMEKSKLFQYGQTIVIPMPENHDNLVAVYDAENRLLGIGRHSDEGYLFPVKVLS